MKSTAPTIASYSAFTGYSSKTVKLKLAKLFGSSSARPPISDFLRSVVSDLSETAAGRALAPVAEGDFDPAQERARRDHEAANKLAMENALRRGSLVEAEEVRTQWVKITSEIRASLMSLPSRMAKELSAMDGPREIQIRIEEEVRLTLESLVS